MKNRFSVLDGEIYDSTAGLIFADGESVYRATPVKDDDLTLLKEIIRRANAFEPGGEVERMVKSAFREGCKEEMLKPSSFGKSLIGISDDEFIEALWADSAARAALAQEPANAKA